MVDIVKVGLSVDSKQVDKGTKALDNLGKQGKKTETATGKMTKSFKLMGGAIAAISFTMLIGGVINTAAAFEKLEASLETVTGSTEKAVMAMQGITDFATQTPFQVQEITDAFIKLKALGIAPTEANLRSFGNTASAMGKSLNQMIEAVADAATGEFERLKEFGIKSRSQGDQVTFTFQGIATTVEKNSKDITKFLESIGETQFAGAMEKQMDTLDGAFSNFNDTVSLAIKKITEESGFNDALKAATSTAATIIKVMAGLETTPERIDDINNRLTKFAIIMKQTAAADIGTPLNKQFNDARESIARLSAELVMLQGGIDVAGEKTPEEKAAERIRVAEETEARLAEIEFSSIDRQFADLDKMDARKKWSADFEKRLADQRMAATQGFLGNMSTLMSSSSKKLFDIGKKAAIASALINTYQAITKTMASVPYPWNIGLAAAQGLAGMVQVQNIRSQSFGGGGGASVSGGAGGGTFTSASVGGGAPQQAPALPPIADEQPIKKEIRVVVEGDGANSEAMRNFIVNFEETASNMGSDTRIVLS